MNNFIKCLNYVSKNKDINNIKNIYTIINYYKVNDFHKDFNNYIIKNPTNYEKSIIYKNDDYELVLISWANNAFANYHNHPKNGCVMKVLDGVLLENESILMKEGDSKFKYHKDFHCVRALEQSYSLHYYSPPNYYGLKSVK